MIKQWTHNWFFVNPDKIIDTSISATFVQGGLIMSQTICLVDTMLRVNATPRDNTDINSGPTILPWGVPTHKFSFLFRRPKRSQYAQSINY